MYRDLDSRGFPNPFVFVCLWVEACLWGFFQFAFACMFCLIYPCFKRVVAKNATTAPDEKVYEVVFYIFHIPHLIIEYDIIMI